MELEVFDLLPCLTGEMDVELGKRLAECLHQTSCAIVKDPRVQATDNDSFLDLMERYFSQVNDAKVSKARPETDYQVGLTPGGVEIPEAAYNADLIREIELICEEDRPCLPTGPDPKCRYMWSIGPRPSETQFYELNAESIIPKAFPEWKETLDKWGHKILNTVHLVAQLIGLGLDIPHLVEKLECGPHLLAPTGADLALYPKLNTCIVGYHSDLNLLTIHGKARYPGLFIWKRNGKRVLVKMPDGCLLLQAGQQLERLTGGYITAGMHEVVVSQETQKAVCEAKEKGKSTWRVSSTLFSHVASDQLLEPMGKFKNTETEKKYPSILAGDYVAEALKRINLHWQSAI